MTYQLCLRRKLIALPKATRRDGASKVIRNLAEDRTIARRIHPLGQYLLMRRRRHGSLLNSSTQD
jgi:hypothetical protein